MTGAFRAGTRGIDSRDRFVGEIGLVFESMHLPRIAGQIFGALLLAPARGYTAAELGEILQVSKGSVSGMTRLLVNYEMVSRVSLPGDRRDRFVIKPGASAEMLLGRMAQLGQLQALAHEGLELLGPDGDPGPLMEVRDMYAFLQRELPVLIDRWEDQRGTSAAAAAAGRDASSHDTGRATP
jgi:hypothetical protein